MTIRAQVTIPGNSGLPEDVYINTFHWNPDGVLGAGHLTEIFTQVANFYQVVAPGAIDAIGEWLSDTVDRGSLAATVEQYDLNDPEPRVPIATDSFTLPAPRSTGSLPDEVAVVLSVHGTFASGIPKARQRGRTYIGPLIDDALAAAAPQGPVVAPALITDLSAAAQEMMGLKGTVGSQVQWVVWSGNARDNTDQSIPYNDRPKLAPITTPITAGWVDNAFDTQRSRGRGPSTRTSF